MEQEMLEGPVMMYEALCVEQKVVYSEYLERDVIFDVYLPSLTNKIKSPDLLLLNDGQDLRKIDFAEILNSLFLSGEVKSIMCVGLHCGTDRINEYGTTYTRDFGGRGAKAGLYKKFVFDELLPYLEREYNLTSNYEKSFAGFSLGALSALDMVWNHPREFVSAGVFSGSLWWRRRDYDDDGYDLEKDRIMHLQVQKGKCHSWLKFFFQCGCLDETADRNNNGIIDSIEDTTDLIKDLKALGYKDDQIHYLQLEDGEHNIETWARALPEFLKWGWGKEEN